MVSNESRIAELASVCGGTYVTGYHQHWRQNERASTREVFRRCSEESPNSVVMLHRVKASSDYLMAACRRNCADEELRHITVSKETVAFDIVKDGPCAKLGSPPSGSRSTP